MSRRVQCLLCAGLAIGLAGLARAQTPTVPESPVTLEAYDLPGYFMTATTSTGAVQMIQGDGQSAAAQWNVLPGLANAEGISFESILLPNNIMRHRSYVFYTDPRATDSLFQNDATFLVRPGLADATAVSFESNNYRGYYLMRNASFGLAIISAPTDLGAATFKFPVMHKEKAKNPTPADKVTDVPRDTAFSWMAGQYAATHDVYLGTSFDDVNNASQASPAGVLVSQGQTAASYDPAGLFAFGQTYYWRIDEVNASPDSSVFKGDVWSFTAETYGYAVKPVKATASSQLNSLMGPEKTIDGSGLDSLDQHGTSSGQMWQSKKGAKPWIQYELDAVYKLYEMWVWNSNQAVETAVGFGAKDVTIETSVDGATWTALANVPEFAQATGEPNYVHNTTVSLGGVLAKFVKLTINTNWADESNQAGLGEVRFFYVPVKAYSPTPAAAATGVAIDSVLSWRPGREAVKHAVYVGADMNAVTLGASPVTTVPEHSLGLGSVGVEYGRTYYWRVDEVNDAATPKSWSGDTWSFSTSDFGVIDDFESYNDTCNRIFFAWVDGFGHSGSASCNVAPNAGNGSGSTVGNAGAPFAEKTVIHGGRQSMPFAYDHTTGQSTSEAVRTFDSSQDWTAGGAKTLVLFFRGLADNGSGQLYATINGVKVVYNGGASALSLPLWKQWNIDLASVATNLKAVKTLGIGVSGSGKGVLYVDDIQLCRVAPVVPIPADPGIAGLAAQYKMEGDVKDSSGKGNNGSALGNPIYVNGTAGNGMAIQFEGVDDYVDLPVGNLVSTLTSCSFAVWTNSTGGAWSRVFDFGNSSTAGYMFLTANDNLSGARFSITQTTNTGESSVISPSALSSGWHHLAVTIDGTSRTMQLFIDGERVASGTTNTLPSALGKTTQNCLGKSQYTADPLYTGQIDEFRVYGRTLTPGEVRYLAGDR